jgi:tetratricopeptide (TPR) repeat protein
VKTTKYLLVGTIVTALGLGAFLGVDYYDYEQEQERVKTFRTLAFQGFQARGAGKTEEAIASYEAALALHDKEPTTLNSLASLYRESGRIGEAEALYVRAYEVNGDDTAARYNAALCSYLLKAYDTAIARAEYLIHHDGNYGKYYRLLAMSHFAREERETAFGYYGVLAQRGDYRGDDWLAPLVAAYDALETKPEPTPVVFAYEKTGDAEALLTLMVKYEKEGADIKALRTARKVLARDPGNEAAHAAAARLLFAHGALEQVYAHTSKLESPGAALLQLQGASLQRLQRYDEAIQSYERAYAEAPQKELLRALAVCAFAMNDAEAAEQYLGWLGDADPRLAHRLRYAIETKNGAEHSAWEKLRYLALDEIYRLYCLTGCGDA